MAKRIQIQIGDTFNAWKVIEANVINPDSKDAKYGGKPLFSKCICTKCNKTIKFFRNNTLKNASQKCQNCTLLERNEKNREVKIGNIYGNLEVIGDAGYQNRNSGNRRHASICKCLLCGKEKVILDNCLQSGNTTSCGCVSSRGEQRIKQILDSNNILYNYDCIFPELVEETKRYLRFDFIIYNQDGSINRFVEFDGNQHRYGMNGGIWSHSETFDIINERDQIKNSFCKRHGYLLVRLPYHTIDSMSLDKIMGDKYLV